MYSTIFIFSKEKPKNEFKSSAEIIKSLFKDKPHQEIDEITDNLDTDEEFKYLCEALDNVNLKDYLIIDEKEKSIEFKQGFEEKWFKKRLEYLKPLIAKQTGKSFASYTDYYEIKELVCNETNYWFKDYTDQEWGSWINLDQLIRLAFNYKQRKFWFIKALNYHI